MESNINVDLFRRYKPYSKIAMIKTLSPQALMTVTPATIERIVKEVGTRYYKSRDKHLVIRRDIRTGNNWNSTVEQVELIKKKLYLNFYVQYDNTDTNTSVPLSDFLRRGDFRGSLIRSDRYGNPQTHYFLYDEVDKQRVIQSLLLEFVNSKQDKKS